MSDSDETLLARMLKGDEDAFTTLYRRRQGPVYRFALHMTRSVAVAEDVTQEVFLMLLESGRRFDSSRGTLLSFLYGIARNHILRRIEKDAREQPAQSSEIEDRIGGDDAIDPINDLTRREAIETVRRAIVSLPPMYREVVVLCDLEDASYEDAAAALDCPMGTVRSRLSRGRAMLAAKLEKKAGLVKKTVGIAYE